MKISELKKILDKVPDDFEIGFVLAERDLGILYPWSFDEIEYTDFDIGYSDKEINLYFEYELDYRKQK